MYENVQKNSLLLQNIQCCFVSPHAFIECIEFIVCQSFLLKYCNNCVVNAAINRTDVKKYLS